MRCSRDVVAPLLASTALALLTACNGQNAQCVNNETHQAVDPSFCRDSAGNPLTTHVYHLDNTNTRRGGFGESLAAVILGSAAAAWIIRSGG